MGIASSISEKIIFTCISADVIDRNPNIDFPVFFDKKFGIIYEDEEGKNNSMINYSHYDIKKMLKNKTKRYSLMQLNSKFYEIKDDLIHLGVSIKSAYSNSYSEYVFTHIRKVCLIPIECKKKIKKVGVCGICEKELLKSKSKESPNEIVTLNICSRQFKHKYPNHLFHSDCILNYIESTQQIECPCCRSSLNISALEDIYNKFINIGINNNQLDNKKKIIK